MTSALVFPLIFLGQYLALDGQYEQVSTIEKMANLVIFPLLTFCWQSIFIFQVAFALLFALAQKLIEKLEKVPETELEKWIFDSLTLFHTFEQKMSPFLLVVCSNL